MVERVPCCVWISNSLALTMLMVPHYWLIENQSGFSNKLRNAIVLTYDLRIDSEVIRGIMHPSFLGITFLVITEKVHLVGSSLFLK